MRQASGLLDAPLNMPFLKTMVLAHSEIWEKWFPLFRPFSSSVKWIGWLKTLLMRLEPVLRNGRGRDGERLAHRDEEWPPLAATGESPCTETKTQHSQK